MLLYHYDTRATGRSSVWLERTVRDREVGGSNPLAPTFFRKKPFGENVEGLSHFRDERCAVERAGQTEDFRDSTLRTLTAGARPARRGGVSEGLAWRQD